MEEMYSAYIYNKWNKCPRVLEINYANGLERWRKRKYPINSSNLLLPYEEALYDPSTVFS